jgi:uncharacterized HAD superfamily protein
MAIIGFDIDDTVANGIEIFLPTQNKYFGVDLKEEKMNGDFHELYGITKKELLQYFVDSGPTLLPKLKPLPYAVEMVNQLHDKGHTIYFITARPEFNTKEITVDWLSKYGFKYHGLYFDGQKIKHCLDLGIEIFVDDMNYIIENTYSNGITSIFVDAPKNRVVKTSKGIYRAKNCKEIYDLIVRLANNRLDRR